MEIARYQPMSGEVLSQDIKKLHQPRRDVFRVAQIRREGQRAFKLSQESTLV